MRLLKRLTKTLLRDLLRREFSELGIYLVAEPEIIRLNETFLRHQGSTDVITFDYAEPVTPEKKTRHKSEQLLCGEIFISLAEAFLQARRFRTTWQSELARYVAHGVLHLCGYDDQREGTRRRMKEQEEHLLRQLSEMYDLAKLEG